MSKYNLTDIFEQYRIGSGFTRDFDYEGMLKAGLETGVDTDIKLLKYMVEDYTDVNYHREASHLYKAIEALEDGQPIDEISMLFGDFHAEIKDTMEMLNMGIPDTLGGFMDSYIKEDTKAVDLAIEASQEKAGITEGRYASIDREVANRIEGFLNIPMKKKLLDAWKDLFYDLVNDEPFDMEDVLAHLSNEMGKVIDGNTLALGLDDFEQEEFTAIDEEDSIEEALPKFKGVPPMKDIVKALKNDAKATDSEIKQFMASVKKAGDEFDDVDDYVEDFKNYVADKALQEHFNRFM